MAAELLGHRRCPLCGAAARVSLAKSGLAVLTCNGCNCQLFTRSGVSDELVRDLPAAEPTRAQKATPPAPDPVRTETTPPAVRTPTPPPPPATKPASAPGWGVLG